MRHEAREQERRLGAKLRELTEALATANAERRLAREVVELVEAALALAGRSARVNYTTYAELFGQVLDGELPLLITAHRAQDIASALRLADEFGGRVLERFTPISFTALKTFRPDPADAAGRTGDQNHLVRRPAHAVTPASAWPIQSRLACRKCP